MSVVQSLASPGKSLSRERLPVSADSTDLDRPIGVIQHMTASPMKSAGEDSSTEHSQHVNALF